MQSEENVVLDVVWSSRSGQTPRDRWYLGVELADCDGRLSLRQSENRGELLCADLWPWSCWLTPVNHSFQCVFNCRSFQAERQRGENISYLIFTCIKATGCFQTEAGSLSPVLVEQRQRVPGGRLQWERETSQFVDRNSTLHHVVGSWDSERPDTPGEWMRTVSSHTLNPLEAWTETLRTQDPAAQSKGTRTLQ